MNATFAADRGSNPDWRSIHIVDIDFFGLFFAILWLIKTRLAKKNNHNPESCHV